MMGWTRTATILGAVGTLPIACASEYDAPPTRCDYFCAVTQRIDCPDDDPVDCVGDCERERSGRLAGCDGDFEALIDCYRDTPDNLFTCRSDESHTDACHDERLALELCAADSGDTCRRWCSQTSGVCSAEIVNGCYSFCLNGAPEACPAEGVAYFQCRADGGDCQGFSRIPCAAELNDWEQCLGFRLL